MMDYYRKFDTVGLISLNDWYVLDFQLKAYDENGNEIPNKTGSNILLETPAKSRIPLMEMFPEEWLR